MEQSQKDVSVSEVFAGIVADFQHCLSRQKKMGRTDLLVSTESEKIMADWGRKKEAVPSAPDLLFQGNLSADIVIVDGEATFFKGPSGQLLEKILTAMHLSPDLVFICNAPDKNQVTEKIKTVTPKAVVLLGQKAAHICLGVTTPVETLCGKFHSLAGVKAMPTHHPLSLTRHPELKRQVWEDMKQVMAYAGL